MSLDKCSSTLAILDAVDDESSTSEVDDENTSYYSSRLKLSHKFL